MRGAHGLPFTDSPSGYAGICTISNNIAENSIKPFTVCRKNWLFSDIPKGADPRAVADAIMDRIIYNSYIFAPNSKKSMQEVMTEKVIKSVEKNEALE